MKKMIFVLSGALLLSACKMSCSFEVLPPAPPNQGPIFLLPPSEEDSTPRPNKFPNTKA